MCPALTGTSRLHVDGAIGLDAVAAVPGGSSRSTGMPVVADAGRRSSVRPPRRSPSASLVRARETNEASHPRGWRNRGDSTQTSRSPQAASPNAQAMSGTLVPRTVTTNQLAVPSQGPGRLGLGCALAPEIREVSEDQDSNHDEDVRGGALTHGVGTTARALQRIGQALTKGRFLSGSQVDFVVPDPEVLAQESHAGDPRLGSPQRSQARVVPAAQVAHALQSALLSVHGH
jgi:hypothetical protein